MHGPMNVELKYVYCYLIALSSFY